VTVLGNFTLIPGWRTNVELNTKKRSNRKTTSIIAVILGSAFTRRRSWDLILALHYFDKTKGVLLNFKNYAIRLGREIIVKN
jgi:hypothetical protein